MVKMINCLMGTEMYVDESRVEEYLALGHTLPVKKVIKAAVEVKKEPVKKTAPPKKTITKKR